MKPVGRRVEVAVNLRVFLVEDSEAMRGMIRAALAEVPGVTPVGTAVDAGEALAAIAAAAPDVVLLDLQLATSSGLTVLAGLQRAAVTPRVIVLTNYPYPQYRERCLALGAEHFFDKSVEFEQALAVLRAWAAGREPERATS